MAADSSPATTAAAVQMHEQQQQPQQQQQQNGNQFAVVLQFEHQLPAQHRPAAPKLKYMNRFGSFVARWWTVKAALQCMSDDELASAEVQQLLLVVQEMVRRANKAVMAQNLYACYL
ncbi:hypothetical protein OEZ86_007962 [Tetradesmus obliquus]|nr:hypothetical protein OEZ86_007962 [Tetradesmus obliquus]